MPRLPRYLILLPAIALAAGAQTLIDNGQVRVLKVTDQPHERHAPHQHPYNRVMIYLAAGRQEIVAADGKKTILEFHPGEVKWSPATGMHTSEVVSGAPVGIIEIEIKKPGDPGKTADCPLHPLRVAPRQATLEFENDQVRVFRVKTGPRGTMPMHEHVVNKVSVNLTPLDERITTAAGQADTVKHSEPTATWGGPVKHREENLSEAPMEAIVVELKN
jgi:quercetin dioxygenase-like cupin family protein